MGSSRDDGGKRTTPLSSDDRLMTCHCPISYHHERQGGRVVAVLDQELPDIMEMCFGRCARCGLPYHTEFSATEPD